MNDDGGGVEMLKEQTIGHDCPEIPIETNILPGEACHYCGVSYAELRRRSA